MKTYTLIPVVKASTITCDRCRTHFTDVDYGWHEMQSIEFVGGYGSIFGDGDTVSIDLCQECLKETLGPWLRVGDNPPTFNDEDISQDLLSAWRQSAERASASVDEAVRFVEQSNQRIDAMKRAVADSRQGSKDLTTSTDEPSASFAANDTGGQDPKPLRRRTLADVLAEIPEDQTFLAWDSGAPMGEEFGADQARFGRVLRRAIDVFGNSLEAVQWLITNNPSLDDQPLKLVVKNEQGYAKVVGLLMDIADARQ